MIFIYIILIKSRRVLKLRNKEHYIIRMNGRNEIELYDYFSPQKRIAMHNNETIKNETIDIIRESTVVVKQRILFFLYHTELYDIAMKKNDIAAIAVKSDKKYEKFVEIHEVLGFSHAQNQRQKSESHEIMAFQHEEKTEVVTSKSAANLPKMNFSVSTPPVKSRKTIVNSSTPRYASMFKRSEKRAGSNLFGLRTDSAAVQTPLGGATAQSTVVSNPNSEAVSSHVVTDHGTEIHKNTSAAVNDFGDTAVQKEEVVKEETPIGPKITAVKTEGNDYNIVPKVRKHIDRTSFHIESDSSMEVEEKTLISHSFVAESVTHPFFRLTNLSHIEADPIANPFASALCLTFVNNSFVYAPCIKRMKFQDFVVVEIGEILRDIRLMRRVSLLRSDYIDMDDDGNILSDFLTDNGESVETITVEKPGNNKKKVSSVTVQDKLGNVSKTTTLSDRPSFTAIIEPKKKVVESTKVEHVEPDKKIVERTTVDLHDNIIPNSDNFIEQLKNTFDEDDIRRAIDI